MKAEIIEAILNELDNRSYTKHEIWSILSGIEFDIESKKVLRCIDALEVAYSQITNHESGSYKQFQDAKQQIYDAIIFAKL